MLLSPVSVTDPYAASTGAGAVTAPAPGLAARSRRRAEAGANAARAARFPSVDMVRGAAIAGMVLVNSPAPGTPAVFAALAHSPWNGWTFADVVFPAFVFVVGASLGLSTRAPSLVRVLRRTAGLFGLGLALNAASDLIAGVPLGTAVAHLRVMGVLQRIALAYLVTAVIVRLPRRWQLVSGVALLAGYGLFLSFWPVPGWGAGHITPWANAAGWVDRSVTGVAHMYHGGRFGYDPEGLVGTAPTVATALIGYWAGVVLRRRRPVRASGLLASAGVAAAVAGVWLSAAMPVNKRLWTPAFVLLMGGIALISTAVAHAAGEVSRVGHRLLGPLRVLGANPLVVYVGSELTADVLTRLRVHSAEPAAQVLYQHQLAPLFGSLGGSAAYGALILAAWWALAWVLDRRGWYLRL